MAFKRDKKEEEDGKYVSYNESEKYSIKVCEKLPQIGDNIKLG